MIISPHFKYSEFVVSADYPELARKIMLDAIDKIKLYYLVWMLLEPVRVVIEHRFKITSGKRSVELNEVVEGSVMSDHLYHNLSCACDFTVCHADTGRARVLVYDAWLQLKRVRSTIGQLIYYGPEFGNFIHVSLPTPKHKWEVLRRVEAGYREC